MTLLLLRGLFVLLVAAVTCLYVLGKIYVLREAGADQTVISHRDAVAIILIAVAFAGGIIGIDSAFRHKKLSAVSGVFLGLIAGLLAAYALSFVVDLLAIYLAPDEIEQRTAFLNLLEGVKVVIGLVTCYIAISLVLQTKDDFRFVLPYVEFSKQIRGAQPIVLDTSALIDGRVLDLIDTQLLQSTLIAPKPVVEELHALSDSADRTKRARGRRGLDVLRKLRDAPGVEFHIDDDAQHILDASQGVDALLVDWAETRKARLMTRDLGLQKVAELRGVAVVNLNDVAKAMRPVVLPGETLTVELVKPGENAGQAVGYLEDGTMVVAEHADDRIGQRADLLVTSTLQTAAGRMIFAKPDASTSNPDRSLSEGSSGSAANGSA
ncbi:MAG: PIN domain-containing protein [Planctomycetota bacterium]